MRKKTLLLVYGFLVFAVGGLSALYAETKSLRGDTPIAAKNGTPSFKQWQRDRAPMRRDYVQQPPLIPHKIRDYKITKEHNKCMTCHSWSRYRKTGATKISLTHFRDRAGSELGDVSPRRYFCTQCHVPQKDAKPLIQNTFKPVKGIR